MPGGDGTGPAGMGPMTGRAAGYCVYPARGGGYGGWGRGGWGTRNWYYATGLTGWQRAGYGYPGWGGVPPASVQPVAFVPPAPANQTLETIRQQISNLEGALADARARLDELVTKAVEAPSGS